MIPTTWCHSDIISYTVYLGPAELNHYRHTDGSSAKFGQQNLRIAVFRSQQPYSSVFVFSFWRRLLTENNFYFRLSLALKVVLSKVKIWSAKMWPTFKLQLSTILLKLHLPEAELRFQPQKKLRLHITLRHFGLQAGCLL